MTEPTMTRRKMIQTSIGAAGAALMAGGLLVGESLAGGATGYASVTGSVYGGGGEYGGSCFVCTTIAGLRNETSPMASAVYWVSDLQQEGLFRYDAADTTTSDNRGIVLVSTSGARFKRIVEGAWDVKWFGAKGDGATNDTVAVQLAFGSAPDYTTIVFSEGVYRLSGIQVVNKHITVLGNRASIRMISKTTNLFQLTGADSFQLEGITVSTEYTGQVVDKYEGHVVYGSGDHIRIRDLHITGSSVALHSANHPIVENCRIVGQPNQVDYGIMMLAATQYVIQGNEVGSYKVDAVKASSLNAFRSPTGTLQKREYGIIAHNFLYDCPEDDAIDIYDGGRKIIVSHNTIYNCLRGINIKSQGLSIPETDYWAEHSLIIGNQINECAGFIQIGGSYYDVSHNICKNEQRSLTATQRGVTIGVDDIYPIVHSVRFTNNTIIGAATYGIEVGKYAKDVQLAFNYVENSGSYAYNLRGNRITMIGCKLKDVNGDRFISVNPTDSGAVSISGVSMVNDQVTTPVYGIRVTANAAQVTVSECMAYNITTPLRDDTAGKSVVHYGNSWNGKSSGGSGSRPAIPQIGQWYYDTTLSLPIYYNGSVWKDVNGTTV